MERSKALILSATAELLILEGPAGINVDAIARQSGVARTTVYRHFHDLDQLVALAIRFVDEPTDPPLTADPVSDVATIAAAFAHELEFTEFGHLQAALAEMASRTELLTELQLELLRSRKRQLRSAIRRACTAESLDRDPVLLADQILAMLWYRHLVSHESLSQRAVRHYVETLFGR